MIKPLTLNKTKLPLTWLLLDKKSSLNIIHYLCTFYVIHFKGIGRWQDSSRPLYPVWFFYLFSVITYSLISCFLVSPAIVFLGGSRLGLALCCYLVACVEYALSTSTLSFSSLFLPRRGLARSIMQSSVTDFLRPSDKEFTSQTWVGKCIDSVCCRYCHPSCFWTRSIALTLQLNSLILVSVVFPLAFQVAGMLFLPFLFWLLCPLLFLLTGPLYYRGM